MKSINTQTQELMHEFTNDLAIAERALFRTRQTTNHLYKMVKQLETENADLVMLNKHAAETQGSIAICLVLVCMLVLGYMAMSLVVYTLDCL